MISRRTILQGAVAATSISILASVAWSPLPVTPAPATALDHPSLYKVLIDQRFAAARAFAHEAKGRGQSVYVFDGDVTDIWYQDLHRRWEQSRAPIAGLTAHGALFCLDHLARDARMRVVHRAEHRFPGHETLYSWVIA